MTHAKKAGAMPATRGKPGSHRRIMPEPCASPIRGAQNPPVGQVSPRLGENRQHAVPWCPDSAGPYRLPGRIRDRLTAALAGFRNRDAAFTLAHFLARFWSSPRRLLCAFPIDRRALAEHKALGLTEARVRGALAVLVEVGFLARYEPEAGKKYQRTESGLQRRAVLHRFDGDYAEAFTKANARALAARGAAAPARRPIPRPEPERPPAPNVASPRPMPPALLAQKQTSPERGVIMGEQRREASKPRDVSGSSSGLEAAIERLRRGVCP